jgi:phosphoribosyl 1,2-cyclic phosphodiesterase
MSIPERNALKVCALASGSKGNSILLDGPEGALLVDVGLSAREIIRRIHIVGVDPGRIRGILVTHDHSDHVRGARVLAKRLSIPVFGTPGTLEMAGLDERTSTARICSGKEFSAAGFTVYPFSTPHDAADPVGFVLCMAGTRVGIATDLGCATALLKKRLEGCDFLFLESNHDEKMLMEGPYPWFLKQRIRSRMGHLSNDASSRILSELLHRGLRGVVLAHLSEMNNRPDLALGTAAEVVEPGRNGVSVTAAGMAQPTKVFRLELE